MINPLPTPATPSPRLCSEALATDITTLVGASSFLGGYSGLKDPQAAVLFKRATDDYCSGNQLILPLPQATPCSGDFFVDLWVQDGAATELHRQELSDLGFQFLSNALAIDLAKYIEGDPFQVAQWLALQFTPENSDRHLPRANVQSILRAGPLARRLIAEGRLARFRDALDEERVSVPEAYQGLLPSSEIPDRPTLCIAYIISVALRRVSYSQGVGQLPSKPIYKPHWIGKPVMTFEFLPGTTRRPEPGQQFAISWGQILHHLLASEPMPVSKVKDILIGLRQSARSFREQFEQLPLDNPLPARGLTDRQALIVETLQSVGVTLPYARKDHPQWPSRVLQIIQDGSLLSKLVIEVVTATMNQSWLRHLEADLRIRFRRDNFWDVFDDAGIRR